MSDRRHEDRRTNPAVPEPLERKRERRQGDRRDSLRKPARFRWVAGSTSVDVEGEVGLGGASFIDSSSPAGPGVLELSVGAQTLHLHGAVNAGTTPRHVHFDELDTATELALAKWLDDAEAR